MATQTSNPMTAMFEQLGEHFSRTMKAGIEFQEQTGRFWKDFFQQSTGDVREQFEAAGSEFVPFSRANVERFQKMFDQQADRTVELLHESFELGKAGTPSELYGEMIKLWRQSFDSVRESSEMFAKANAEMLERYSRFASGRVNGKPGPKVAK